MAWSHEAAGCRSKSSGRRSLDAGNVWRNSRHVADVFVSYSRRASEFVSRMVESIERRGKEVWLDTEGLVDAEVFPPAIRRAIEQADTFLFVITPAAVESPFCESEVDYASDLHKRIVPVLREPVPDEHLPAEIRDRNWIPFTERDPFEPSMDRLLTALDRDPDQLREHTRWLVKAIEWERKGRDRSFLLRGSELKAAEAWLATVPEGADPAPNSLQRQHLLVSREGSARRQRALVGASLAVTMVQPRGVHGQVDQPGGWPLRLHTLDRRSAGVRGPVIDDPVDGFG